VVDNVAPVIFTYVPIAAVVPESVILSPVAMEGALANSINNPAVAS
jgi:hypothetical protein